MLQVAAFKVKEIQNVHLVLPPTFSGQHHVPGMVWQDPIDRRLHRRDRNVTSWTIGIKIAIQTKYDYSTWLPQSNTFVA